MRKKQWVAGLSCVLCAVPLAAQAAEADAGQNVVTTPEINVTGRATRSRRLTRRRMRRSTRRRN